MHVQLDPQYRNTTILVVDDMEFNRMLICDILSRAGCTNIVQASNGLDALGIMQSRQVDVVILDLIMPEMDGFEFCKVVRKQNTNRHIPILVQTAMADSDERLDILSIGASDLIVKPINPNELILRLNLHLEYASSFNHLSAYQVRLEEELEVARQTQAAMLPSDETIEQLAKSHGVYISSYYQPSLKIGGDLWNIIPISDTKLVIYALDIAGHGVMAAINAFRIHSQIDATQLLIQSPAEYMQHLNQRITATLKIGQFAVCFMATIDLAAQTLTYASAAFTTPMIYSPATQEICMLPSGGMPLGILDSAHYTNITQPFLPHDSLLLYSDALIETKRLESAFLSEEEVAALLKNYLSKNMPIASMHSRAIASMISAIHAGEQTHNVTDDLMIVLCTRTA